MDDKKFNLVVTKLLKEIIYEKEQSSLEQFVKKYNLPNKIQRKIKHEDIKWTIIDVMIILEILNISLYDFAVMIENDLEEELHNAE